MRIESMGNGSSYQQTSQAGRSKGTESAQPVKKKASEAVVQQKKAQVEAQVAAEVKNQHKEREVIKAIESANKHIRTYDRRLEFSIHEQTKQIMVKVINTEDDSVIREIPSEKVLDMVGHMWEVAGILVDEKR